MGAPKTKGNCASREELEERVRFLYMSSTCNVARIAKHFKVSETTVHNILTPRKPVKPAKPVKTGYGVYSSMAEGVLSIEPTREDALQFIIDRYEEYGTGERLRVIDDYPL